eukprot:1852215-Amphidinium_carterae.1
MRLADLGKDAKLVCMRGGASKSCATLRNLVSHEEAQSACMCAALGVPMLSGTCTCTGYNQVGASCSQQSTAASLPSRQLANPSSATKLAMEPNGVDILFGDGDAALLVMWGVDFRH